MSDEQDLQLRVRSLEGKVILLQEKVENLENKVESLNSGISRGLWIIGGGFLAAIVTWITRGGINGGP